MTIDQTPSDHVVDDAIGAGVAPVGAHWTDIDRLREQHRYYWSTERSLMRSAASQLMST